jgi:thiamine pyrophosphate-dependent acetolactate synthase large subunit-like protein
MGGRGRIVRSLDDVHSAVKEWVANPGPMMLDVRIPRSVITLPYRRIHYGRDE